MEESKLQEIM